LAFLGFGDQSCAAGWLEAKRLELWVGGKKQTNKEKRKGVWWVPKRKRESGRRRRNL